MSNYQLNEILPPTYRKCSKSNHVWDALDPEWSTVSLHIYTRHLGRFDHDELRRRLLERTNHEFAFEEARYILAHTLIGHTNRGATVAVHATMQIS